MSKPDDIQEFLRKTGRSSNDYRQFEDQETSVKRNRWAILSSLASGRLTTSSEASPTSSSESDWPAREGSFPWQSGGGQKPPASVAQLHPAKVDASRVKRPVEASAGAESSPSPAGRFGHLFRQVSSMASPEASSGKETPLKPLLKRIAQ